MPLQSFGVDGFLSPDVLKWGETAHTRHAAYFDLAEDLNRRVTALLLQNPPPMDKVGQLVASLLLARTLTSYCAAITLAKRGMIADARAIVRSCAESAIALGGIATIDGFFDQMVEAHDSHRRKIAQMFLETPPTQQDLNTDQVCALKEMVEDIDTTYGRKPNGIIWASVAEKAGMRDLYNLVYRDMSGDGAHATIESLTHHINTDAENVITSLSYTPRAEGVADVLSEASRSVLLAAEAFAKVFAIDHGLSEHLTRWKALTDKE
jgi:hypothetical protein